MSLSSQVRSAPLLLLFGITAILSEKPDSCTPEYEQAGPNNTMCAYQDDPAARFQGIIEPDLQLILSQHNRLRSALHAADMAKLYWDAELAKLAQKMAQSCLGRQDTQRQRQVPGYNVVIGQLMEVVVSNSMDWAHVLRQWGEEQKPNFVHGTGARDGTNAAHYVQMINARTTHVGCGYAECPSINGRRWDKRQMYYCNYAPRVTSEEMLRPYHTGGDVCSNCNGSCNDHLCDCGAQLLCRNGGQIDINTCSCLCPQNIVGTQCETVEAASIQAQRHDEPSPGFNKRNAYMSALVVVSLLVLAVIVAVCKKKGYTMSTPKPAQSGPQFVEDVEMESGQGRKELPGNHYDEGDEDAEEDEDDVMYSASTALMARHTRDRSPTKHELHKQD